MPFTLQINAATPEELKVQLQALADAFGGAENFGKHVVSATITETGVTATIAAPSEAPHEAQIIQTTALPPETNPAPAPERPPVYVVKELSVAERRTDGINMLVNLFNRDPATMPKLNALQAKYGVKRFADITDDQVPAFYNDALLTVNGTAEVSRAA